VFFIFILFAYAPLGSAAAQTESSSIGSHLDAILSSGTLRFGIPGDYPPFGAFDEKSGRWTGIDIDEASAMAKALGVHLVFVKTSWPSLLSDLYAGKFDIAGGGISISLDRQKHAFFSTPILQDGKTPITRCTDVARFSTLTDIDQPGVRVITPLGGTNESFDRSHLSHATILTNSGNQAIFEELLAGHADVMITDATETRWQHKLHPELCSVHPEHPFSFVEKAYLMPRDIVLKQWIDAFLHIQESTGELDKVLDHWLK
jgi:cyclohexadienyl dehydratase